MDIKRLIPAAGIMKMFCNHLNEGILAKDAMMLYKHARGIFEDTPAGDPAFVYFHSQVTTYQKLCTYLELLENPDSKNIALCFNPNSTKLYEILDVYGIPYVPHMNVRTGMLRVQPQGIVADIYNSAVSEENRQEAMEFLADFKPYASLVFKPLHFQ